MSAEQPGAIGVALVVGALLGAGLWWVIRLGW